MSTSRLASSAVENFFEPLARELVATQPDVLLEHTRPLNSAPPPASLPPRCSVRAALYRLCSCERLRPHRRGSGFIATLARPGGNFTGGAAALRAGYCWQVAGDAQGDRASALSAWLSWPIQRRPPMTTSFTLQNPLRRHSQSKLVPSPVATANDIKQAISFIGGRTELRLAPAAVRHHHLASRS